jgi:putative multiple sugar transport system substrate-binding protein
MRKTLTGLVAIGLATALAACGGQTTTGGDNTDSVRANDGSTIGLALPTKAQTRWIADGTNMVQQFTEMNYKVNLQYAADDNKTQVAQIQAMIDQGDKLLVIGAVDGSGLTSVLANAAKKHIPVIAYDRLIVGTPNVAYYATFDNLRVGVLQGSLLVKRLGLPEAKGPFNIELFGGAATDNNAKVFYTGAMSVLQPYIDSGKLVVRSKQTAFAKIATANWDGPTAGKRMTLLLSEFYKTDRVDAVLAPNDGLAIGVLTALKADGYGTKSKPFPLTSGQDAELNSVKSIIAGDQTGTVYKDTRELAKVAVQMANAELTGGTPAVNDTTSYNNGVKVVPTYLLQPVAIDQANYKTLLVTGGYYTAAQLGIS